MDEIFKLFEEAQKLVDLSLISIRQKQEITQTDHPSRSELDEDVKVVGNSDALFNLCSTSPNSQHDFNLFDSIPQVKYVDGLQQKLINLKMNSVSNRRKDQLFKRYRKQQEERIVQRRKQLEQKFPFNENLKKQGQFTLKSGQRQQKFTLKCDDFQKLRPQTDLNDTILDNYLKIMQTHIIPKDVEEKTFIFSSFFISKLLGDCLQGDYNSQKQSQSFITKARNKVRDNYEGLKRWTRKIDIFSKQILVIPINAFKHWNCLIIIAPHTICNETSFCKILYFDSMFEKRMMFPEAMKMYLQLELAEKKMTKKSLAGIETHQMLVPRQTNTHDCGLYTLCYIQYFLCNRQFMEADIQFIKNRHQLQLFPRSIIFTMRECLRNMFYCLLRQEDKENVIRNYMKTRQQIIKNSIQDIDYDQINQREFKKYYKINSQAHDDKLPESQFQFQCKIKFYLDCQVNHYEKDR